MLRAPAMAMEQRPARAVPSAMSGMRLWRSAYQPIPMTAKVRKKPITERRLMIDWMSILRSWMMNGPA